MHLMLRRSCAKAGLCVQALAASLPTLRALPLCRVPGVCLLCLLVSALARAGTRALSCFSDTLGHGTLRESAGAVMWAR